MDQTLEQRVAMVIADYAAIDKAQIVPTAHLVKDLGLDSLDQVEVIMGLEDEFVIAIPDDVSVATVADVHREVRTLLGEAA